VGELAVKMNRLATILTVEFLLLVRAALITHRITALVLCATLPAGVQAEPFKRAEVTRTVNSVSLLPEKQSARPASIGDLISGQTGLRTADDSRAELSFPDLTITRVGSNALFRFLAGGREMTLDGGTMLFSSPKGAGGGQVQAGAITAAVTGTDFLVSYVKGPAAKGGRVKVICLSRSVLVYFTANPRERRLLRPGQMVEIPNGATKFLCVSALSLSLILSTNELFESGGFGPLPSKALLKELAENQKKHILRIPDATAQDEEALRSAFAILESRGLDAAVVVEAVGQVVNNPLSVETLVQQVARALFSDEALMIVVTEVAKTYPSLASSIARGVAEGAPRLAPTIAATLAPAITLGVYDNAQTMTDKPLAYEEIFVDQTSATGWVGTNKQSVYDFATAAWAKGRTPIISIEPFSGDPLDEIVSGKRDKELANIASQLAQYGGPAIIRWGHEPEKSRYPWGGKPPEIYILAYRYVVDYLRKYNPQQKLSFMWSPVGDADGTKYYPGSHYVDYVGCSLFDTENQSFAESFAPKYQTLAQYCKPIIIAECGVQAKHDQAAWVAGLKASASQFPLLKSVIYFNAVDPHPWVNGQKPDWRIDPALW
jgi:Glycosyl hydrolase family 26/FecR protein